LATTQTSLSRSNPVGQNYPITALDVVHAGEYLRPLLLMRSFESRQNVSCKKIAERDFDLAMALPGKDERAGELNVWCEKHLKAPVWGKLKLAIRKRRERKSSQDKTITISAKAFEVIRKLANRDEFASTLK
jgi:macrodomain Ter protein organizer (MatP/YcbG family)